MLRRFGAFELGEPLSSYSLLLAPLVDGQHFVWNLGSWFIFPLFLTQVIYSLIRRVSPLYQDRESVTFILCLIPGALAVNLCHAGQQAALPLFALRALILLPGYAGGQLYKRVLERHDNLPTVPSEDQSARIAELEAEIAELEKIIETVRKAVSA